jgi:hypothetical protein
VPSNLLQEDIQIHRGLPLHAARRGAPCRRGFPHGQQLEHRQVLLDEWARLFSHGRRTRISLPKVLGHLTKRPHRS